MLFVLSTNSDAVCFVQEITVFRKADKVRKAVHSNSATKLGASQEQLSNHTQSPFDDRQDESPKAET